MDGFEHAKAMARAVYFAIHVASCPDDNCDVLRDFNEWWQSKIKEQAKSMGVQEQSRMHWRDN